MQRAAVLLAAYDEQLRGAVEAAGAVRLRAVGPLAVAEFGGGRAFVSYRDLGTADAVEIRALVARGLAAAASDPAVEAVEWKTRAHDLAPGLHEALVAAGFEPQEPESIMIGAAELLAVDLALPEGVLVRRVADEAAVRRASAVADAVFGETPSEARADDLLRRVTDGAELWVAESEGAIVSTGRLEPVAGTAFAGLWGGATVPEWRRRGVYRALTAARARSAIEQGVRFLHSDSTESSRPILERAGLTKVGTTTPYEWRRPASV